MSYYGFRPYVPVAKRREKALKEAQKAQKNGKALNPVHIEGRKIAKTVWGQAWCDNLESYSDYENRLPRGRTYVRSGAIIDLVIDPGKVRAQVMGSSLYRIEITVAPAAKERWGKLVAGVTGSIASLVELLQGRLSKGVMEKICHPDSGLFPSPREIALSCSCPDWASMCKHVAAALYGVGARLDSSPELLFTLRNVSPSDLIAEAAKAPSGSKKAPAKGRALDPEGLDDLFGIELEKPPEEERPLPRRRPGRPPREESTKFPKKTASPKKSPEKPTVPEKKQESAKKSLAQTKKVARPVGKTAVSASRVPEKSPSQTPREKKTVGSNKGKGGEKEEAATKKKGLSVSTRKVARASKTVPSAPGHEEKPQRGRPPGVSSSARKSPPSESR